MLGKIKYTCKNCGWTTSIREEWADLRPKRCMNKKCNTSFHRSPDSLIVELPQKIDDVVDRKLPKKGKRNEEAESDS